MSDKIRVVLPEKYDLVVGDTFQLFYRGIVEAPEPSFYDILAVCERGKGFPRYFEFLPEEEGEYKLRISVYGADRTLLGEGETILKVVNPKKPKNPVNILCIGDSLTGNGVWVNETNRRLTQTNGEPKGLGYSNFHFIGTQSNENDDVRHEAYGGWTWKSFTTYSLSAVWIKCKHNKTEQDQHSLWEDENNNLWKIETIEEDRIKFIKYGRVKQIPSCKSTLIHKQNAMNCDSMIINDIQEESANPFYDVFSKKVDLISYCQRNNVPNPDVAYILLGANGLRPRNATPDDRELTTEGLIDYCDEVVGEGKELVDKIKEAFPDIKIKIVGLTLCSVKGGTGTNYGALLPYCDVYGYTRYVMELNKAYEKWTNEPGYKDYMEFINLSGQFDADYAYPNIEKTVNTRCKQTEMIDTNAVHPTFEGFMMIADAIYRNIVASFCV